MIIASFLRQGTRCQLLIASPQSKPRWKRLILVLLLILFLLKIVFQKYQNFQAEIFKGRLGLVEGEIVRSVSPELARAEVAELVRILTWKVVVVLSLYKGTELVRISSCRIKTLDLKVRAYKEGSYRAVARVEEGSDSSGRERALW